MIAKSSSDTRPIGSSFSSDKSINTDPDEVADEVFGADFDEEDEEEEEEDDDDDEASLLIE
jgi:hypothetical protein